jgi:hypothetical protein
LWISSCFFFYINFNPARHKFDPAHSDPGQMRKRPYSPRGPKHWIKSQKKLRKTQFF